MKANANLIEGKDYFIAKDGFIIFTKDYLKKRGFCCQNGCTHCPYREGANEKR